MTDWRDRAQDLVQSLTQGLPPRFRDGVRAGLRSVVRPVVHHAPVYDGDERWAAWHAASPVSLELATWLSRSGAHRQAVGDRAYRDRMIALLTSTTPRDCAAASMGCTRRSDRACREPQVCIQDPDPSVAERMQHRGGVGWRQGPIPGACDRFSDDAGYLWAHFSTDDRHLAVLWSDEFLGAFGRGEVRKRLFVDGRRIETGERIDMRGYWVGNRWFVIQVSGPQGHPMQEFGPGTLGTRIPSLLVHDAEQVTTTVFVAADDERWTDPCAAMVDGVLCVFPDRPAREAQRPSRHVAA